jgi:hypothetical protein
MGSHYDDLELNETPEERNAREFNAHKKRIQDCLEEEQRKEETLRKNLNHLQFKKRLLQYSFLYGEDMKAIERRLCSRIEFLELELRCCRDELDMINTVLESITPEEFFDTN